MKTKNLYLISIVLLIPILLTACGIGEGAADPVEVQGPRVTFTLSGSGSVTPVLSALAPAFEADNPGYSLNVLSGSGTGGGVQGLLDGVLDVAGMARPPKDTEPVEYIEFGQVGQAIITHPDVGINDLTTSQIISIFSGTTTRWSSVGGPDLPIILYVRDEGDSSTKALRQAIFGEDPFPESVAGVLTSQTSMLTAVEGTPGGIGIATWPTVIALGANVQAVTIDGVFPNDPAYPMINAMGIGFVAEHQADVQPLIDWLLSENGHLALNELDILISQ